MDMSHSVIDMFVLQALISEMCIIFLTVLLVELLFNIALKVLNLMLLFRI